MAMTLRQAFKAGFLLKFAELGVTPDEVTTMIKAGDGADPILEALRGAWSGTKSAVGGATDLGMLALLGLPPLVGVTGGMLASKFTGPDDADIELAKKKLKLMRYQQMINEVNQRRLMSQKDRSGDNMF